MFRSISITLDIWENIWVSMFRRTIQYTRNRNFFMIFKTISFYVECFIKLGKKKKSNDTVLVRF